jgi:hypothetical protein
MESNVKRQTVSKHNLKDYVRICNYIYVHFAVSVKKIAHEILNEVGEFAQETAG